LGFDQGGIGGISQGDCRIFLTNAAFRQHYGSGGLVMVWLNLESKHEVGDLYDRWRELAPGSLVSRKTSRSICANSG
jgi:hypothetical protein